MYGANKLAEVFEGRGVAMTGKGNEEITDDREVLPPSETRVAKGEKIRSRLQVD